MISTDIRALDGNDLQQRRKTKAGRSSDRRHANANSHGALVRVRRRRKPDTNRNVSVAMLLSVAIAAAFLVVRLRRRGDKDHGVSSTKNASPPLLLRNWKPKPKRDKIVNLPVPSVEEMQVEQRSEQRELRYRSLYKPKFDKAALGYDIYNCPSQPVSGYPKAWTTTEVLGNWNPRDVTTLPPAHRDLYQGLCVFDYETQYDAALSYRNAEKPFVVRNDPHVAATARRWEDDPEYLHRELGDEKEYRTERSPTNLFMWYRLRGDKRPEGYRKPPNDEVQMTFGEYLEHALTKDGTALGDEDLLVKAEALKKRRLRELDERGEHRHRKPRGDSEKGGHKMHSETDKKNELFYFRLNADLQGARKPGASRFIYDELPFFDPRKRKRSAFYIVEPDEERGINCRFGMRGVTAANHFDMSRNMIAVFGGERRYVMAHPSQCDKMALYPKGHPSVRHSSLDWSEPDQWEEHPEFQTALVNEVVLHAGDVLYLPTNWFHFIVNLSLNYQCNARSGITDETSHLIKKCGF